MLKEVMQEAYSQEVSRCGFWPGRDQFLQPVYYSYCYPLNVNFGKQKISPPDAFYDQGMGEIFLPYDVVRNPSDPEKSLMDFQQSTCASAAISGKWDRDNLEK
jgi:hypothetical protein